MRRNVYSGYSNVISLLVAEIFYPDKGSDSNQVLPSSRDLMQGLQPQLHLVQLQQESRIEGGQKITAEKKSLLF
jgi:hypothetical protein